MAKPKGGTNDRGNRDGSNPPDSKSLTIRVLPPPNPPHKNRLFLYVTGALVVAWIVFLAAMAFRD